MEGEKMFKDVTPLENHILLVEMESGSIVSLDMSRRKMSVRFGLLQDQKIFQSVTTDGYRLIFHKGGHEVLEISTETFLDLLVIDRTK